MLSAVTVSNHRAKDNDGEIKNASDIPTSLASDRGDSVLQISASRLPMNDPVPVKLTIPLFIAEEAEDLPADPYPRCRRGRYAILLNCSNRIARRSRSGRSPRRRGNSI